MLWCTGQYKVDFCKKKCKELRESGKYKRASYKITHTSAGEQYGKIYVYEK